MRYSAVTLGPVLLLVAVLGCGRKDAGTDSDPGFLANTSGEAKEALAAPVSFQLNEDNYAKWEIAERNLDDVPSSEFARAPQSGGTVTDRAVARLESSARAKRAIEVAGLSVRDFVLETIALAQAVQAAGSGASNSGGVTAANFAFVERYRGRIRGSGLESGLARQSGDSAITDSGTAAELAAANADRSADSIARSTDSVSESGGSARVVRPQRDSSRDSLRDMLSRQR